MGQLDVRHLQPASYAGNRGVLAAPVELEGLAGSKAHRHIGMSMRRSRFLFTPPPNEESHPAVAARIPLRL